jgi:hypothetical protein
MLMALPATYVFDSGRPPTEKLLPNRAKLRREMDEPKAASQATDIFEPTRRKERTERQEPSTVESRTDME